MGGKVSVPFRFPRAPVEATPRVALATPRVALAREARSLQGLFLGLQNKARDSYLFEGFFREDDAEI